VAEGLDLFRPEAIATGGRMIPSGNLSLRKRNLVGWLSRSLVGTTLADGLCNLWGESFSLKAPMIGVEGPCPFEISLGICFTTEEKHGKPKV
jgi:hypothetical protein